MNDHNHQHKSHTKEYIIVFFVLSFLTVLELMIPGSDISSSSKAIGLIGLALGKAFTVAYFYMHLKEEKAWLRLIAAVPISAAIFAVVIILESQFR